VQPSRLEVGAGETLDASCPGAALRFLESIRTLKSEDLDRLIGSANRAYTHVGERRVQAIRVI